MPDYSNHSKILYRNHDEIQAGINSGLIDAFDLVFCADTKEIILIKDDLSLFAVKSKVYRYLDIESAETALNSNPDTYEGQIISILSGGKYKAYIVNRNIKGQFTVSPITSDGGNLDYDTLSNKPISNLFGEVFDPVILDKQNDGVYKISGAYKFESQETIYSSFNDNIYMVRHDESTVYVKRIGALDITDYIISEDGTVTTSVVPTTEWLKNQGYVTESYVDAKIAALDFITKEEVEDYVQNIVLQTIESTVYQKISEQIDRRFESATQREIVDLFS